jgi:peptidyl-prolyl cis-trans isomerase C
MRKTLYAGLLALPLAAPPAWSPALAQAPAQPPQAATEDQVLARVNDRPITVADVAAAAQGLPEEYRGMPQAMLMPLLLDQLISQRVIADAARAAGVDRTDSFRRRMARAEEETLAQTYVGERLEAVLTEDALRARFKAEVTDKPAAFRVCARHILVASEADARAAIAEIGRGADFAAVARARSSDGSRAQGGDLGCFGREEMVAPFAEAAFALPPGQMSQNPVQTQFGWHVIRVERREEQAKPSFEQAAPQLRRELAETSINALVEQLRGQAKIERLDQPPPAPRPALDATPPPPARR